MPESPGTMERKQKRTVISIQEVQPELDFDEAEHNLPFSFPEYQRELLWSRIEAGALDLLFVGLFYLVFVVTTFAEMPAGTVVDRRVAGVYSAGYLILLVIYFFLFMLSASQTPGMNFRRLTVVTREGSPLDLSGACIRSFGYLISVLPVMLGFVWALIDPEHLTWADKVSSTYVKRVS